MLHSLIHKHMEARILSQMDFVQVHRVADILR